MLTDKNIATCFKKVSQTIDLLSHIQIVEN